MKCFHCKTEMFSEGGLYSCSNCKIIINLLYMSRINQQAVVINSYD